MKRIFLSQGSIALVDDEDFPQLRQHRWSYRPERGGAQGYAVRNVLLPDGRRRLLYLHRDLMQPPPGHEVVFLNGDRLDCRRDNLQVVTTAEARRHHRRRRDNQASRFKGVSQSCDGGWAASIRTNGVADHLGVFDTEKKAALAYDAAARERHGDMAVLNFPD